MYYYQHTNGTIHKKSDFVVDTGGGPNEYFQSPFVKKWWQLNKLVRGQQIAYVPSHADFDIKHPSVEFGFVTSGPTEEDSYFCRFWSRNCLGSLLRTRSNSELTPGWAIVVIDPTHPLYIDQKVIDKALEEYC
jgi:hypothetical protein